MVADLGRIAELAAADGLLATGTAPALLHDAAARDVAVLRRKNGYHRPIGAANRWTPEEREFVRVMVGHMSEEQIGRAIGRSANAVKIMRQRKGWPAGSKRPEELTACRIARLMRKCAKTVESWIELGILPGRLMPARRTIHLVRRVTFERWLVNPANWIYFDHRRIVDPRLRRLVELAKSRWPDEWLTTGQAAELLGIGRRRSGLIERRIVTGKLRGRFWANWHVLRSDVEKIRIVLGRGSPGRQGGLWTERGDQVLQFFVQEGKSWQEIERLMGPRYSAKRAPYRYKVLQRRWKGN